MTSRKTFIKAAAMAGGAFILKPIDLLAHSDQKEKSVETKIQSRPTVISTWPFGMPANKAAFGVLLQGGRALDAVETGVKVTEADPNERSVGYGGRPDREGRVTLDSCIMDDHFNIGSVAFLEHIKHPVSVARAVMEKTPHVMLVGEGAFQFALSQGFKKENLLTEKSEKEYKEWLKKSNYVPEVNIENHDTIGMLALDAEGNLSGACTTSGLAYKMRGRIGDSPIIGAGLYVDNEVGAATATGQGEEVIRIAGSHLVVEFMRMGKSPEEACKLAVERVVHTHKSRGKSMEGIQVAFIALNKKGEYGAYCLQAGFSYALQTNEGSKLQQAPSLLK